MKKSESSDCNQNEVEWEIIDLWQDHHLQYSHSSHHVGRDEERPPSTHWATFSVTLSEWWEMIYCGCWSLWISLCRYLVSRFEQHPVSYQGAAQTKDNRRNNLLWVPFVSEFVSHIHNNSTELNMSSKRMQQAFLVCFVLTWMYNMADYISVSATTNIAQQRH